MERTAKFIRTIDGWSGDARLYELDPPLVETDWDDEEVGKHRFVIVSAVNAMFSGPETYIFPATEEGKAVNYGELSGSFRGARDHEKALSNAGYQLNASKGGRMSEQDNADYAKSFSSEKYGQLVVMNSTNEEGCPAVVVFFKHPDTNPSSVAIGFKDDDKGWESRDSAYQKFGLEQAEKVAGKVWEMLA